MTKKIKQLVLLFSLLFIGNTAMAQSNETIYFYTTVMGKNKSIIFTSIQSTNCYSRMYDHQTPIRLQVNDYLKNNYENYYEYSNAQVWFFNTKNEATIDRNKNLGEYSDWKVTNHDNIHNKFYFNCNN
uniref:hypothetical protein n=1 Tax=Flavobacterium sp. TaxID=239 RepID=UPI004049D59C